MAAYGLYTHIASNKVRSMLLLAGLFLLIYVLVFAGMFGFTRKEFFDLGASRTEVEAVPTVKF